MSAKREVPVERGLRFERLIRDKPQERIKERSENEKTTSQVGHVQCSDAESWRGWDGGVSSLVSQIFPEALPITHYTHEFVFLKHSTVLRFYITFNNDHLFCLQDPYLAL